MFSFYLRRYKPESEFYIAMLNQQTKPGRKYVISISYEGILQSSSKGFYKSSYKNDDGDTV